MWLEKLKDLKQRSSLSSKQIAERTSLPERTVKRIFAGETDNPYVDTLHRIVSVLGGSLDDILTDTKAVVANEKLIEVNEKLIEVKETADVVTAERDLITAENAILKDKVAALTAEIDLLKMQLKHKDELLALHNYYNKIIPNQQL
jgi:transcriptional regulator with XRE-family HTH domain